MNWFIPALVKSSVGSSCGTSGELGTMRCWCRSKYCRKERRISLALVVMPDRVLRAFRSAAHDAIRRRSPGRAGSGTVARISAVVLDAAPAAQPLRSSAACSEFVRRRSRRRPRPRRPRRWRARCRAASTCVRTRRSPRPRARAPRCARWPAPCGGRRARASRCSRAMAVVDVLSGRTRGGRAAAHLRFGQLAAGEHLQRRRGRRGRPSASSVKFDQSADSDASRLRSSVCCMALASRTGYPPNLVISGAPRWRRPVPSGRAPCRPVVEMPCTFSLNSSTFDAQRSASS